jgi:hypothetical protein
MSESWRRKSYYRTRVLVQVGDILDCPYPDMLICLTGGQVAMLRKLCEYLHRRSTWVSEYNDNYYLAPSDAEWDALEGVVAELEDTLMGCPEIVTQLEAIVAGLEASTSALDGIAAAAACLCSNSNPDKVGPVTTIIIEQYIEDGGLQVDDPYPGETPTGETSDMCAIAQLTWQIAYEFLTEIVQPAQKKSVDILMPIAMGVLASWVGTPVLGIPVGILVALLWDVIDVWVEGSLMDVANAIWSNKDDIMCALYIALKNGGPYASAEAAAMVVIDGIESLSPVDKLVMHALVAPWAQAKAALAWTNQTAWAIANVSEGACADCEEEPPIEGSDWIAYAVAQPNGDLYLDHTAAGDYWAREQICGAKREGYLCGFMFTVVEGTGCDCFIAALVEGGCGGEALNGNNNQYLATGVTYYWFQSYTHDAAEVIATIHPGASYFNGCLGRNNMNPWMLCGELGYGGTGTRLLRLEYLVYMNPAP